MTELLHTYLQDHHAGAVSGVALFRRVAENHSRAEVRTAVARLAEDIEEDKKLLEELMNQVGASPSLVKDSGARVAEVAGQLKPNQRFKDRSPLSDLLELEALTAAVMAKRLGWRALLGLADPRLSTEALERLLERAISQGQELDELHVGCADVLRER
ncbi:hypothetical protein [Enemella dayhoffiae]|nr:hypothetical protein [Enemella dayhoffiae]